MTQFLTKTPAAEHWIDTLLCQSCYQHYFVYFQIPVRLFFLFFLKAELEEEGFCGKIILKEPHVLSCHVNGSKITTSCSLLVFFSLYGRQIQSDVTGVAAK